MKLLRRISERRCKPSIWWGYCWSEDFSRVHVIAPLGLNVVIAGVRWLYHWVEYRVTRILWPAEVQTAEQDSACAEALEKLYFYLIQKAQVIEGVDADGAPTIEVVSHLGVDAVDYACRRLRRLGEGSRR